MEQSFRQGVLLGEETCNFSRTLWLGRWCGDSFYAFLQMLAFAHLRVVGAQNIVNVAVTCCCSETFRKDFQMLDAVFVVGTGRSGTHFTCRALAGFENISDPLNGHENGNVLYKIANSAIYHKEYPIDAVKYYSERKGEYFGKSIFLDQHHPNLFFTEDISRIFLKPVFLYPSRPVVQVVASMLQHKGVLAWYDVARRSFGWKNLGKSIPLPNRFLGVENKQQLFDMELHKLCALRVLAHYQKMKSLSYSDINCRFVKYEALISDQEEEFGRVFSKAEMKSLGTFNIVEVGNAVSLNKYSSVLSARQIDDIAELEQNWNDSRALADI